MTVTDEPVDYMKVINAHWEERNTGLKTCEIIVEKGDDFQDYLDTNVENNYKYSIIKVPVGNLGFVHKLESIDYRYLENQFIMTFEVTQLENLNPVWDRLLKGFSCKLLTTHCEIENVLSEVSHKMFEKDRFSLDPFWQEGLSSLRYQNWIKDLFESGSAKFYVIIREGKEMGFFSIKDESKSTSICPIAGIYNKYKFNGYIFVLTWFWLVTSRELGYKKLTTSISSNNRAILSSVSKVFSFSIRDTYIVLRKVFV